MKKKQLLWAISLAISFLPHTLWAEEDYVVVMDGTITFYYDGNKSNRTGIVYEIADEYTGGDDLPAWCSESVVSANFDSSFSNYVPSSTARWFHHCSGLTKIENIANLNTSKVTNMAGMFYGCKSLTELNLSNFNTSNVTNMYCMFYECSKLKDLDLSSLDVTSAKTMVAMFYGCTNLKNLDVSSFDTKNVEDMQYMFFNCSSLESLSLTKFNTSNVTNMEAMFAKCSSIKVLDLCNFNTAKVTNMLQMFYGCSALTTIYVEDIWSTESVTLGLWMFDGCTSLQGSEGTTVDFITSYLYAKVDEYVSPGYFTYKNGSAIMSIKKDLDDGKYYSLDGKLQNNPVKGIIIRDGKKLIIK